MRRSHGNKGFTLIELAIVLVIIGLIVGGVLVGQDLIRAAEVRAQISQIEKYNTAVNTFRVKFNAIPGDMPLVTANLFGFTTDASCDGTAGKRDGNGLLDSDPANLPWVREGMYEVGLFWQDLSSSAAGNLIDGSFTGAGGTGITCATLSATVPATGVSQYLPPAKMGRDMYVYVYNTLSSMGDPSNWYGLSGLRGINTTGAMTPSSHPLTVMQAYNIDKKIDDGLPGIDTGLGNVQAVYLARSGASNLQTNVPFASPPVSTSCVDPTNTPNTYAITVNGGTGANCALSFRFQ